MTGYPQFPAGQIPPQPVNLIPYGDPDKNPWQEGETILGVSATQYFADLVRFTIAGAGTHNIARVADAGGDWFGTSITVPDAIAAGDYLVIDNLIEEVNAVDLKWGTADAQPLTVAFEVKSSVVGTYSFAVANDAGSRSYVTEFTVDSAGSEKLILVTIPPDTGGTWGKSTGKLHFRIGLSAGASFQTTPDSWQSSGAFATSSIVEYANQAAANYFYYRKIRAYAGSVDYGPIYPDVGEVLRYCQRYLERSYDRGVAANTSTASGRHMVSSTGTGANSVVGSVGYKVDKRTTTPNVNIYSETGGGAGFMRDLDAGAQRAAVVVSTGNSGFVAVNTAATNDNNRHSFQWESDDRW